jgi:chorismate mutase
MQPALISLLSRDAALREEIATITSQLAELVRCRAELTRRVAAAKERQAALADDGADAARLRFEAQADKRESELLVLEATTFEHERDHLREEAEVARRKTAATLRH